MPGNVAEASEFYAAFKRRHYVGPEQDEGCARVKIPPVLGQRLLKAVLLGLVRLSHRVIDDVPGRADESVSRLLFQGIINRSWHGEVTFLIPDTIGRRPQAGVEPLF